MHIGGDDLNVLVAAGTGSDIAEVLLTLAGTALAAHAAAEHAGMPVAC